MSKSALLSSKRLASVASAIFVAVALLFGAIEGASAQTFPTKPIRMIVAYPAAGSADIIARIIAEPLSKILGQPVAVENVGGASGAIGTQRVVTSPADGYTIQLANTAEILLNPLLMSSLSYNPETGLAPIAFVGAVPSMLVGKKGIKLGTLRELVAAKGGSQMTAGTTGGASQHIALELLKIKSGAPLRFIHYAGGGPALLDVVGGHIDFAVVSMATALPQVRSGGAIAFGITTPKRSPLAPEIPTFAETPGLEGFDVGSWFAFYAPAGVPQNILNQLEAAVLKVLEAPDIRSKLEAQGMTLEAGGQQALKERVAKDKVILTDVVKSADIKIQN